jgi:hypothetical protein
MLATLVVMPLAEVTFLLLWPVVFVALILLIVALSPFVIVGAGVRAMLQSARRVAD